MALLKRDTTLINCYTPLHRNSKARYELPRVVNICSRSLSPDDTWSNLEVTEFENTCQKSNLGCFHLSIAAHWRWMSIFLGTISIKSRAGPRRWHLHKFLTRNGNWSMRTGSGKYGTVARRKTELAVSENQTPMRIPPRFDLLLTVGVGLIQVVG